MYNPLSRKRIRKSFGKISAVAALPNLIEVQKNSYDKFLQIYAKPEERTDTGLQRVLRSIFPINDFAGAATLEFVRYEFDNPKYDVDECIKRGISFSAPLRVTLRLIIWEVDEETGAREIKGIKEQDVYIGDIPLMTSNGTFVINGTERVIVSQMHRSPGVFFDHDHGKSHSSGKYLYSARVIPYRGSWLDFEFDAKDFVYFRIDRRRKIYVTSLLRSIGLNTNDILSTFYSTVKIKATKKGWSKKYSLERYAGIRLEKDLIEAKSGKVAVEAGTKITVRLAKKLASEGLTEFLIYPEELNEQFLASDIVDKKTGEILGTAGEQLTQAKFESLEEAGLSEIPVLDIDNITMGSYILQTLHADKNQSREEALMDIYKVMRPGEPPTVEAAETLFNGLFFDNERYDLSDVGRVKTNARLNLSISEDVHVLTKEDIIEAVKILMSLKDGNGEIDDIDHLGNRRVRSVGELIENQFRLGLLKVERAVLERMGSVDADTVMPHDLINTKPLNSTIREFFASSQLSQFMDQTNPLSEITHKRRLSALGPGGLERLRAGFEVRDVHPTHYGRICPIETPEGPNIGLINSLATYARVNRYGFIESPYRKVVNAKVTQEVIYLSSIEESKYTIAQANARLNKNNSFEDDLVSCRKSGDFIMSPPAAIEYMDVSPKQVVSVAASLIPFLENDDANRALMGSNMQRQAVPLVRSQAPVVGTGMEAIVARDSGATVIAKRGGIVDQVDATRIVIRATEEKDGTPTSGVDIYSLQKFQRTNQSTCINQRPLVQVGEQVKAGEVLADGPSTDMGELALGRNVLVGFMPWNGYNFEDSILISENLVKDDVFTSIHIEEFEVMARDTKLGPEEITRDIPNTSEENLRHLDEVGIVHIGAEIKAGDILVGKVTPKSESPMTPEEKLLRAIFGEKAADVRDSSLRMPPGSSGTVVEVRVFSRRGIDKDQRALTIEREEINRINKDKEDELIILESYVYSRLSKILDGKTSSIAVESIKSGSKITPELLDKMAKKKWWNITIKDEKAMAEVEKLRKHLNEVTESINKKFKAKVEKLQAGDDLPSGVLKMVKVFVAVKRKLQPGDKMAGRHGNKGVISRICPVEDMPFLEDGTPLDVVLNPLGVPSRMNVGQILETHLGWAAVALGKQINKLVSETGKMDKKAVKQKLIEIYQGSENIKEIEKLSDAELETMVTNPRHGITIATPVFDGAKEEDIKKMLGQAGLGSSGQVTLYDGLTGEKFDRQVTVGYIYILKLHHLVDDKIHARSIGPYSLVTQQPLGGKSHFGGQRFGEMECWALQAYGAAFTLQELLTVKSDDVAGRTKVYESIIRGDHSLESGIPESFHVMIKELRSLGLNVQLQDTE